METHTVFTLFDGARFDTIDKAKEHCVEEMGATLRTFITETTHSNSIYKQCLITVVDKKYDKDIINYVAWRKEHDTLLSYNLEESE